MYTTHLPLGKQASNIVVLHRKWRPPVSHDLRQPVAHGWLHLTPTKKLKSVLHICWNSSFDTAQTPSERNKMEATQHCYPLDSVQSTPGKVGRLNKWSCQLLPKVIYLHLTLDIILHNRNHNIFQRCWGFTKIGNRTLLPIYKRIFFAF